MAQTLINCDPNCDNSSTCRRLKQIARSPIHDETAALYWPNAQAIKWNGPSRQKTDLHAVVQETVAAAKQERREHTQSEPIRVTS